MTKQQMVDRINEILETYLMDEGETYACIDMYFERGNESQTKRLIWGDKEEGYNEQEQVLSVLQCLSENGFNIND